MNAPSGTVTLVFTDIESSTARWEANAEAMAVVLRRHDALVREAIFDYGGFVFKHIGDGICAAFTSAPAAVSAAEAIINRLAGATWPDDNGPLVRIGMHSGVATPVDGDYFGPTVNRAARVMASANGGQVVCSSATAALCPNNVFRDAGEHLLAGIGPERLFVLVGVGAAHDRLLRSPTALRPLGVEASTFVGRDDEMEQLSRTIAPGRLITLVGPGGVGKTRLALETANRLLPQFADGVYLCELAAVTRPEAVAAAVAETVGARHQAGMELVDAIAAFIERRRCLVVFDNCEHVIDAVVPLVRRLRSLPGVALLATSRELLGLRDEQVWPVDPLEQLAAIALFVDRCRQRDPHFSLDPNIVGAVEEICVRLDGIPLALELAAARTSALSPASIAERLHDRFRLLRGGRRDERHKTLSDTVQWSYDLLSPAEATFFDRLAVFAGGFTLAGAEHICSDEAIVHSEDVVDHLCSLVDKSMVRRDHESADRFILLETLRNFGENQLASKRLLEAFRARHARYFRDIAEAADARIFSSDELESWAVLAADWDNIRSASTYALHAQDFNTAVEIVLAVYFFAVYSMRFEVADWAAELLAEPIIDGRTDACKLRGILSWAAWSTGDFQQAIRLFDRAVRDGGLDPVFYFSAFVAFLELDDLKRAADSVAQLRVAADPADARSRFCAAVMQPYYFSAAGEIDLARRGVEEALDIAKSARCSSAIAHALHVRGFARRDGLVAAREDLRLAVDASSSVGARHVVTDAALQILARLISLDGDVLDALRASRSAVASSAALHYLGSLGGSLPSAAVSLARAGDADAAVQLMRSLRQHGYRIPRRADRALSQLLGSRYLEIGEADPLSMLEAAKLALNAIDGRLAATTVQPSPPKSALRATADRRSL